MKKKKIIILDVETTNTFQDNLAYDIGFIVADNYGNIYERKSYMVYEMFFGERELLKSAFYCNKIPQYWEEYKAKQRELRSILTIKNVVRKLIKEYDIKEVYAYNAFFDRRSLNRTLRYLTKSKEKYFFPYGVEFKCIWHFACNAICTNRDYLLTAKQEHWYRDETQNVQTSAEKVYAYLSQAFDFAECHTGLEDTLIEYEIYLACLKKKGKLINSLNSCCWRIPQKKFKKLLNK